MTRFEVSDDWAHGHRPCVIEHLGTRRKHGSRNTRALALHDGDGAPLRQQQKHVFIVMMTMLFLKNKEEARKFAQRTLYPSIC
jgi:hypothetical protein